MSEWKRYIKTDITEMRPYVPGEDLHATQLRDGDNPINGGMIARNINNHSDQWFVANRYFKQNYAVAVPPMTSEECMSEREEMFAKRRYREYDELEAELRDIRGIDDETAMGAARILIERGWSKPDPSDSTLEELLQECPYINTRGSVPTAYQRNPRTS